MRLAYSAAASTGAATGAYLLERLDFRRQIRGLPLVAAIEAGDLAIGVQQRGAQVVDDLTILGLVGEAEVLRGFADIAGLSGCKAPMA